MPKSLEQYDGSAESERQFDAVTQLLGVGEAPAWTRRRPQPTAKQRVSDGPVAKTISALARADYRLEAGEVTGHTDTGAVTDDVAARPPPKPFALADGRQIGKP